MEKVRERLLIESCAARSAASLLLCRTAAAAQAHPIGLAVVTAGAFSMVAAGVCSVAALADEGGFILSAADCFPWFAEGPLLSAAIPAVAVLLVIGARPRNANEVVRLRGSVGIRSMGVVAAAGCSLAAAVLAMAAVGIVGSNYLGPVSSFGYDRGMLADVMGVRLEMPEPAGYAYAAALFFMSAFLTGAFSSAIATAVMHLGGTPVLSLVIAVALCQANAASGDILGLMCGGFVSLVSFGEPVARGAATAVVALSAAAALAELVPRRDWLGP